MGGRARWLRWLACTDISNFAPSALVQDILLEFVIHYISLVDCRVRAREAWETAAHPPGVNRPFPAPFFGGRVSSHWRPFAPHGAVCSCTEFTLRVLLTRRPILPERRRRARHKSAHVAVWCVYRVHVVL